MESLQSRIETQLSQSFASNTYLKVMVEESNCGAGVTIWICSSSFEGVSLLKRHQMLQKELEQYGKEIHKSTLKPMTPAQLEKKKEKGLLPC
jgi:stress-induced morphogen